MNEKKVQVISFFVMHKYEDHEMTTVKSALGLILLEPYRTKSKTAHISLPMKNGGISKFKCKDILKIEYTDRCLIVSVYNTEGPRKKSIMFFLLDQELNLDLWQSNFKPRNINIPEFCDREFRHSKCRISDTQLGMYFMVLLQKTEEGCRRFHQAMKDSQRPQVLWILGLYKVYILYVQENRKLNPQQFKRKLIYSEYEMVAGKIFRLSGGLVTEEDLIVLCGKTHRCNGTFGNLRCARVSFLKCSNCNMARYCDTKCQASNFQKHKLECQSLAKSQETFSKVHKAIEQFLGNRLDCKLNLDIETFISVLCRKLYEDMLCESLEDKFNQLLVNFPVEIDTRERHMFNQLLKLRLSFVKLPCNNHVVHKVLSQDNLIDLILKECFRRYKKMQKSKTQKSKRQRGG